MYSKTQTEKAKIRRRGQTAENCSILNPNSIVEKRKDEKLNIRISREEKQYLQALAAMRGVTVSKLVMDSLLNLQPQLR